MTLLRRLHRSARAARGSSCIRHASAASTRAWLSLRGKSRTSPFRWRRSRVVCGNLRTSRGLAREIVSPARDILRTRRSRRLPEREAGGSLRTPRYLHANRARVNAPRGSSCNSQSRWAREACGTSRTRPSRAAGLPDSRPEPARDNRYRSPSSSSLRSYDTRGSSSCRPPSLHAPGGLPSRGSARILRGLDP